MLFHHPTALQEIPRLCIQRQHLRQGSRGAGLWGRTSPLKSLFYSRSGYGNRGAHYQRLIMDFMRRQLKPEPAKPPILFGATMCIGNSPLTPEDSWNRAVRGLAPLLATLAIVLALSVAYGGSDRDGNPLPPGVVARIGSARLRHGGFVVDMGYTPDGNSLASACTDGWLRLWDTRSGSLRWRLALETDSYERALAISPDGTYIAVVSSSEYVVAAVLDGALRTRQVRAASPGGKIRRGRHRRCRSLLGRQSAWLFLGRHKPPALILPVAATGRCALRRGTRQKQSAGRRS